MEDGEFVASVPTEDDDLLSQVDESIEVINCDDGSVTGIFGGRDALIDPGGSSGKKALSEEVEELREAGEGDEPVACQLHEEMCLD